jgi:HEAT repeat protein
LLLAVLGGAGYFLWTARSAQREQQPGSVPDGPLQDLVAVESLVEHGSEAVPELIVQATGDNPRRRRMALMGLGRLGSQAAGALETVRSRLTDEDRDVRSYALRAFIEICSDSDDLWRTIARMLDDPEKSIRESAANHLLRGTTHHITITARRRHVTNRFPQLTHEGQSPIIRAVLPLAHSERAEARGLVIKIITARDPQRDDPAVSEILRSLLNDRDAEVRAAASSAVAWRGAARPEDVREWLCDADPKVIDSALAAVPRLGPDGEQVIPELIALVDKVPDDRLAALISALGLHKSCAKQALPGLLRRVAALEFNNPARDDNRTVKEDVGREVRQNLAAVEALLEIDPDPNVLAPILKRALANTPPELSQQAAAMLARIDPQEAGRLAAQLIKDIEADATQGRVSVTVTALGALSGLGPSARAAVPLLIRLIEQKSKGRPWLKYYAIAALGGIGPDSAPAVPRLLALLTTSEAGERSWVRDEVIIIKSLGKIGPAARSAVPAILDILDQDRRPTPQMGKLMQGTPLEMYPPSFHEAILALGMIGDDSGRVLTRLRREFAGDFAIHSVTRIDEVTDSRIQQRIDLNAAASRRLTALEALILLCRNADHADAVLSDLIGGLEDESGDVRLFAACLGQIQGDKTAAVPGLIKTLEDDDPWVVSAAVLSLREIGPAAASAAPRLRELAEDGGNRDANGIRDSRHHRLDNLRFGPGGFDLDRLSVMQAARLALEVLEATGD